MSRATYTTGPLERYNVDGAAIQQRFDDLTTFVNTTKLSEDNFLPRAINGRHLNVPITVDLSSRFGYDSANVFSGPWGGWYVIDGSVVSYDLPDTGLDNIHELNKSTIQVEAILQAAGVFTASPTAITSACIGYSLDGGVTWVPLTSFARSFEFKTDPAMLGTGVQPHYITGALTWRQPGTYPTAPGLIVMASVGGLPRDIAGGAPILIGVMTDSNLERDSWIHGQMFCTARSST